MIHATAGRAGSTCWAHGIAVLLMGLTALPVAGQGFGDTRQQRARDRVPERPPLRMPGGTLAALPAAPVPDALLGAWSARVHCGGQDHVLSWVLGPDRQAALTLEPAPDAGRGRGPAFAPGAWQATHDDGGERLLLRNSSDPRSPVIDAVVTPEGWVGELAGRGWEACSHLIGLRADAAVQLASRLPAGTDGRRQRANPLDQLAGRLTRRERCDRDTLAWVDRYLDHVAALGPRPSPQALRRVVTAMYADEVFAPAFGKTLADMGATEAQHLKQTVQTSYSCNLTPERRELANRSILPLALPLADGPQHSRRQLALDLSAQPILARWGQTISARVTSWSGADVMALTPAAVDGAAAAVARFAAAAGLPEGGAPLLARLEGLRQQVASAQASQAVQAQAASVGADLAALQRLVQQLRPRPGGAVPDAAARAAVAQQVNALLPEAVAAWAARAEGVAGWQALQVWRQGQAEVLRLADERTLAAAQASVDARQGVLTEALITAWRQEFARQVDALPPGVDALAAGTALEHRLRAEAAAMTALPQVQALAAERAARRARDLTAATPALVAQAAQAPHYSALQALRTRHLLPGEEGTPAAQTLSRAIDARQAQVAPLSGLPAADYLNALYGDDVAQLQALDQAFREPYKAMLLPMLQQTAPLMNLFAQVGGVRMDYAAMATRAMDNISLIAPMFAVYLIEFEGRLGPCLDKDAVRFTITTTSETVYRDGWGNYKYSVPDPDRVEHFRVNRRFESVFREVGLSNPQSLLGQLLDSGFRNGNRVGIGELVQGTRALMQRFDREGCNSPLMRRMEAAMLAQFARYRQGNREVLDAAFGGTPR
ncbi:MAG: hypothetical protein H6933_14380 [Burkholderiaceae bacterium]|nr:hypothetical protein [Burkholderiaceae bacterium]